MIRPSLPFFFFLVSAAVHLKGKQDALIRQFFSLLAASIKSYQFPLKAQHLKRQTK